MTSPQLVGGGIPVGWAAPGIPWAGGRVWGLTPPARKGCCGFDDDKILQSCLQGGHGSSLFPFFGLACLRRP
jgi:hypothetical protein